MIIKKVYLVTGTFLFSLLFVLLSCVSREPLTKKLYFGSMDEPSIYLPNQKEIKAAEKVAYSALKENVVIKKDTLVVVRDKNKTNENEPVKENIREINLEQVVITANRPSVKITNIRNSKLALQFMIRVPASMIAADYRATLTPVVFNEDSIFTLPALVLKGKDFQAKQTADSLAFLTFKKGIIAEDKQDSAFINKKSLNRDLEKMKQIYYGEYVKQHNKQNRFYRWEKKVIAQELENKHNSRVIRLNKKTAKVKSVLFDDIKNNIKRSNSNQAMTDYFQYRDSLLRESATPLSVVKLQLAKSQRDSMLYDDTRFTFKNDVPNRTVTNDDLILLEKLNENSDSRLDNINKIANIDTYEKQMITFPDVEKIHKTVYASTPNKDFIYLYTDTIDVADNFQRKLRVTLESNVTATDRSTRNSFSKDTVTFLISSIADLADSSLASRFENRPGDSIAYMEGFHLLKEKRNYYDALNILGQYTDYNTAVCLVGMGYTDQALNVLNQLTPTTKTEYLKAMIYSKQGKNEDVKSALINACKIDPFTATRIDIEPEFARLIDTDPAFKKKIDDFIDTVF